MRGGSVGRLVRESQATNMHLVNKWLYVIFGRYGGFRGFSLFPRELSPSSHISPYFSLLISPHPFPTVLSRYRTSGLTLTRPRRGVKERFTVRAMSTSRCETLSARACATHNVISRSVSHRGEWLVTVRARA